MKNLSWIQWIFQKFNMNTERNTEYRAWWEKSNEYIGSGSVHEETNKNEIGSLSNDIVQKPIFINETKDVMNDSNENKHITLLPTHKKMTKDRTLLRSDLKIMENNQKLDFREIDTRDINQRKIKSIQSRIYDSNIPVKRHTFTKCNRQNKSKSKFSQMHYPCSEKLNKTNTYYEIRRKQAQAQTKVYKSQELLNILYDVKHSHSNVEKNPHFHAEYSKEDKLSNFNTGKSSIPSLPKIHKAELNAKKQSKQKIIKSCSKTSSIYNKEYNTLLNSTYSKPNIKIKKNKVILKPIDHNTNAESSTDREFLDSFTKYLPRLHDDNVDESFFPCNCCEILNCIRKLSNPFNPLNKPNRVMDNDYMFVGSSSSLEDSSLKEKRKKWKENEKYFVDCSRSNKHKGITKAIDSDSFVNDRCPLPNILRKDKINEKQGQTKILHPLKEAMTNASHICETNIQNKEVSRYIGNSQSHMSLSTSKEKQSLDKFDILKETGGRDTKELQCQKLKSERKNARINVSNSCKRQDRNLTFLKDFDNNKETEKAKPDNKKFINSLSISVDLVTQKEPNVHLTRKNKDKSSSQVEFKRSSESENTERSYESIKNDSNPCEIVCINCEPNDSNYNKCDGYKEVKDENLKKPNKNKPLVDPIVISNNCQTKITAKEKLANFNAGTAMSQALYDVTTTHEANETHPVINERTSYELDEEEKKSSKPLIHGIDRSSNDTRIIAKEKLAKFNSGTTMSETLYDADSAVQANQVCSSERTKKESIEQDEKKGNKPLLHEEVNKLNGAKIVAKEKLINFNLGNEMTHTLYGAPSLKEKSVHRKEEATANISNLGTNNEKNRSAENEDVPPQFSGSYNIVANAFGVKNDVNKYYSKFDNLNQLLSNSTSRNKASSDMINVMPYSIQPYDQRCYEDEMVLSNFKRDENSLNLSTLNKHIFHAGVTSGTQHAGSFKPKISPFDRNIMHAPTHVIYYPVKVVCTDNSYTYSNPPVHPIITNIEQYPEISPIIQEISSTERPPRNTCSYQGSYDADIISELNSNSSLGNTSEGLQSSTALVHAKKANQSSLDRRSDIYISARSNSARSDKINLNSVGKKEIGDKANAFETGGPVKNKAINALSSRNIASILHGELKEQIDAKEQSSHYTTESRESFKWNELEQRTATRENCNILTTSPKPHELKTVTSEVNHNARERTVESNKFSNRKPIGIIPGLGN